MSENAFLPPPVRLCQASVSEGGGVTRRSFIKRTGGATVATMVAWNLGTQQARAQAAGESGSASYSLVCITEPQKGDYEIVWPDDWVKAKKTQIAARQDGIIDWVSWFIVHWVEIDGCPQQKDAEPVHASMTGSATARMAIVQGFWTYNMYMNGMGGWYYGKKSYNWKTVADLTAAPADRELKVYTSGDKDAADILFPPKTESNSNISGAEPIYGKPASNGQPELLGWAMVGLRVEDFVLTSHAVFVPLSSVANESWTFSGNITAKILDGGASWSQTIGINPEPPASPLSLAWAFAIREGDDDLSDVDPPVEWESSPFSLPASSEEPKWEWD